MKALTLEQIREHKKELYEQQEKDFDHIDRLQTFRSTGWEKRIGLVKDRIDDRYTVLNELVLQEAKLELALFQSRFDGLELQESRLEGEE